MGYERGSIIYYSGKLWFFDGYSTNKEHQQTYRLRGMNVPLIEVLASECTYIASPSEIKHAIEDQEAE